MQTLPRRIIFGQRAISRQGDGARRALSTPVPSLRFTCFIPN